jgi:hypothetical protein
MPAAAREVRFTANDYGRDTKRFKDLPGKFVLADYLVAAAAGLACIPASIPI